MVSRCRYHSLGKRGQPPLGGVAVDLPYFFLCSSERCLCRVKLEGKKKNGKLRVEVRQVEAFLFQFPNATSGSINSLLLQLVFPNLTFLTR